MVLLMCTERRFCDTRNSEKHHLKFRLSHLPMLLQHGHQKVQGQIDVVSDLLGRLLHVSNGAAHAHDLLELELDSALGLL